LSNDRGSGMSFKHSQQNQSLHQQKIKANQGEQSMVNSTSMLCDDDDISKLGKLSLINASARYQLISAN
jgi:hypothetical protein